MQSVKKDTSPLPENHNLSLPKTEKHQQTHTEEHSGRHLTNSPQIYQGHQKQSFENVTARRNLRRHKNST